MLGREKAGAKCTQAKAAAGPGVSRTTWLSPHLLQQFFKEGFPRAVNLSGLSEMQSTHK